MESKKKKIRLAKVITFLFLGFFLLTLSFNVFSALDSINSTKEDISDNFNVQIKDAENKKIDAIIKIYQNTQNQIQSGMSINSINPTLGKDILVLPQNSMIKEISFKNVEIETNQENFIKIDYPNKEDFPQFLDIYAIDPSEFNFTEANVTAIGEGENLMKCKTWNFTNRECQPICDYDELKKEIRCQSGWEKIQTITSNTKYNFLLTPIDPAFATYNLTNGAPTCETSDSPCIANSSRLQCNSNQASPGPEPNYPNTIDSCTDSTASGTCHSDESVENITITSLNGTHFTSGDTVTATVEWYCYNSVSDRIALYYTNSTSNINWKNKTLGTDICPARGYYKKNITFNLDNTAGSHAIRGIIKYYSDITNACPGDTSYYTDQDDLVFQVANLDLEPTINLNLPTNSSTFYNTQDINFNFTVTDDLSSTLNCSIYLDNSLNTTNSSVLNNTLTNFQITDISYGDHYWNINCSDGLSNISETRYFSISDTESPAWSNPSKNKTTINSNDLIKFNATWNDNLNLSGYIFSTNDSGQWVNSSYQTFTGTSNVSENISTITASAGSTVGWYFWANDSYGNSNQTDIQTFTVENITTTLEFSVNQTTYPQGDGPYKDYIIYIPFQARYLDSTNNPISNATCTVTNDKTSDTTTLTYNETSGNYTGQIDNYEMYDTVSFNVTCSKTNYITRENTTTANVWSYGYIWGLAELNYSTNSTASHWIKKEPTQGAAPHVMVTNITTTIGNNFIDSFPVLGLGKNNSLLKDYNALGTKTLRLNVSINDSTCKPLLELEVRNFNLTQIYSVFGEAQTIPVNTPTIVETNITENFTIQQSNYFYLELYLNCSAAVSEQVTIYHNYTNQPANLETHSLIASEITGSISAIFNDETNPIIGPNETLNITANVNFSLNNTALTPEYINYFFAVPLESGNPDSIIPNTIYIYNSTGQLIASDNDSAGAPDTATLTSNNVISWYTETIPAQTSVIELGRSRIKDLVRDNEALISNSSGTVSWNATVDTISSIPTSNVTVWTNYSAYGVNNLNYTFNITKTQSGVTTDLTNNVTIDSATSKITFPNINASSTETVYTITASDISSPEIHLISPSNNTLTKEASQIFSCNITDTAINNLTLYIWNSTDLVNTNSTILTGTTNETNFTYTLPNDNSYTWNCLGSDVNGNSAWSTEGNYTLTFDSTAPTIIINSPLNQTYNNRTQLLNITSSGTNTWYNFNGTNITYTTPINTTFNIGPNTLIVYSNDSAGNFNMTSITFDINDTVSPTWSSPNKNKTTINSNDLIKFNTTWDDDLNLSGYIFSTNNSGEWVNSSYQTFIGTSNVSENISIITSSAGNAVGWYFWANDSYGNSNQTDIQTFVVENITTNLTLSVNQTIYPQGDGLYEEYMIYIPFQGRYLDSTGNPISNATCIVSNNETSDTTTLTYNETSGNYTGQINNYKLYDLVSFNISCSKSNYVTSETSTTTNVWTYLYLWELDSKNYNANQTNSHWLRKAPTSNASVYTLTSTIQATTGDNFVADFPVLGLGKNNSVLRDYNIIGNKTLRLNLSINDTTCKPLLKLNKKSFELTEIFSDAGEAQAIPANTPTVIESNISEIFVVAQSNYISLELYLNCSANVSEEVNVYYNYSGEPANIEIHSLISSEISGTIISIEDTLTNPTVGPNETLNVTENVQFLLNNTGTAPQYMEYFLLLPIVAGNPSSVIQNTIYIYNSTGQLLASDNASAGAPNIASADSDNIVSWYTETIPNQTAVIETGNATIKDLIRNNEVLVSNSDGTVSWNVTVDTISTVETTNITAWTNYSAYGVNNLNYTFNITKTKSGVTTDLTNNVTIDSATSKITFPNINASSTETIYTITASDISSPEIHLISPSNNTLTKEASQIFSCNITDTAINNLTLYVWNSTGLINTNTTNLTGTTNETNFTYTLPNDANYTWSCRGADVNGNSGWSVEGNYTLTLDSTAPSVIINSPLNQTYDNRTQLLNITSSGTNTWYNFNGTNITYTTELNIDFSEGSNTITIYSNDSAGNLNITSLTFETDTISPLIDFEGSTENNGSTINRNNIQINISSTDSGCGLNNITINLYNLSGTLINSTNSSTSPLFANFTNLEYGNYTFNATSYDCVNNKNSTSSRSLRLNSPPSIEINSPSGELVGFNTSAIFSINASDIDLVNYSTVNITLPNNTIYSLTLGLGQQSDNFNSNTLNTNWVIENDTVESSQSCTIDINSTIPGEAYTAISGDGSPSAGSLCTVLPEKIIYGDFDVNISFNITNKEGVDYALNFIFSPIRSSSGAARQMFIALSNWTGQGLQYEFFVDDGNTSGYIGSRATEDTFGKLRVKRVSNNFTFYTWNNTNSSWIEETVSKNNFIMDSALYIGFESESAAPGWGTINVSWDNYSISDNNFSVATFNNTPLEGTYNVSYFSTDNLGAINNTQTTYFQVAYLNTAPSVPFISTPTSGSNTNGIYTISWSQSVDSEDDSLQYNITLLNTDRTFNSTIVSNYGDESTTSYEWNTTEFQDGNYSIKVLVFENESAKPLTNNQNFLDNFSIDNSPPQPNIISPLNQTYTNKTILASITLSEEGSIWYNFNGTNITYSSPTYITFNREANNITIYTNDSLGNLNTTIIFFYVNVTGPTINSISIKPPAIVNGSSLNISINASNSENFWANVTLPNSFVQRINLVNNTNTTFSNTSLVGRYNITFYSNDSIGNGTPYEDYFETFLPVTFNFTVIDSDLNGLNSSMEIIYRNGLIGENSSENGTYLDILPNTLADLKIKSYSNKIQVTLVELNLSQEDQKTFGIDKLSTPVSGYLVTYGINNSYNFTNASVRIYYDDLSASYSNEDNLKLHKCDDYNFEEESCSGEWIDITSNSTQNQSNDYFEYITTSFSGFSLTESITTTETPSSGGRTGTVPTIKKEIEEITTQIIKDITKEYNISIELVDLLYNGSLVAILKYKSKDTIETVIEITNNLGSVIFTENETLPPTENEIEYQKIINLTEISQGNYQIKIIAKYNDTILKEINQIFILEQPPGITGAIIGFLTGKKTSLLVPSILIIFIVAYIIINRIRRKESKKKYKKKAIRKK